MADVKGKKNPRYKTGLCMPGERKGIYNSWCNMRQRCNNPKNPKYARYGGRGIKVCDEWQDISGFLAWAIKSGWKEGLSIDRIDNDGNYCPENCRWVSMSENSRKKRTTKIDLITAQEIRSRSGEDWYKLAKEYNCTHGNIWFIMNNFTHLPDGECTAKIKTHRSNRKGQWKTKK